LLIVLVDNSDFGIGTEDPGGGDGAHFEGIACCVFGEGIGVVGASAVKDLLFVAVVRNKELVPRNVLTVIASVFAGLP
jgi:hypothetical protein